MEIIRSLTRLTAVIAFMQGVSSLAVAGEDFAPPFPPPHPPFASGDKSFSPDRLPPYLENIKLTDAQQTRIKAILTKLHDEMKAQGVTGKEAHKTLHELAFSDDYSEDKAKVLAEETARNSSGFALAISRTDHAIYQELTPEQKSEVKENLRNIKEKFEKESRKQ